MISSTTRRIALALVAAIASAALSGGCRRAAGPAPDAGASSPASSSAKRYPFHGVIREVKNGGADVMVAHDAVPGFMGAMTMLFPVHAPPGLLLALSAGDTIEATLVVEESRYWLEGIRRTRGPALAAPAAPPTAAGAPDAAPPAGAVTPVPNRAVSVGEKVPDFELVDQTGQKVRLSQMRGEPVAVTFLYTRCPIATACPMTTAKFSRLDAMLRQKGFGRLLVVTVDPEHDTPAVLADYGRKAGADPKRWKFLTGDPSAVADVASSFGVLYYPDHGQVVHGQAVAVVDPDGRLSTIYYGESWEPEHILRDIEKARKG